jgi:Cof subfamily protein (haloacid dehalogenase superfamily)
MKKKPSYKLLYLDVDSTLIRSDMSFDPRTIESLALCQKKGMMVSVATGRMFRSAFPYAKAINANAPTINYNGAAAYSFPRGEEIFLRMLPKHAAIRAIELASSCGFHVNCYIEDRVIIEKESETSLESARKDGIAQSVVGNLADFLERTAALPIKLMIIAEADDLDVFTPGLNELIGRETHIVRSEITYLEVLNRKANKGYALKRVAEHLHVPRDEIVVFGDSLNDIEMIEFAGLGIAMGNARPELKQHADYVTASNDENGVALAIQKLVL